MEGIFIIVKGERVMMMERKRKLHQQQKCRSGQQQPAPCHVSPHITALHASRLRRTCMTHIV